MQHWDMKKWGTVAICFAILLGIVWFAWPARAAAADKGGPDESPLIPGLTAIKGNWTGVYVGVGGGYQIADTKLSLDAVAAGPFNGAFLDGLSGDGWAGDARLGLDWQVSGSPFVFGILGGYNIGAAESEAGFPLILGATVSATLTPTWYVGGRIGMALPTKTLVYGGAAYQQAKGELGGVLSGSATEYGIMYLAGLEQAIAPNFTLGAEYSLARYEFDVGCGASCNVNVDPDVHAFKVRLNWRPFSK